MSKEIVSRLLSSKSKILFESSTEGESPEVLTDITDEDFERELPEDEFDELEVKPIESELEDTPPLTESEEKYAPCVCGSEETVSEDGVTVCAECGRELSLLNELGEPLVPREEEVLTDSTSDEKTSALQVALRYWRQGQYQKAMSICKKYGISDKEFAYGLVSALNESDEYDEEDSLDEAYFFVRYNYDGDALSDYESTVIVKASSEQEAIQRAKRNVKSEGAKFFKINKNHKFGVQGRFDSLEDYKKKFPHSNYEIYESDQLEVISPEESSNLDKNIIRAIQTQVSTSNKPDLDAAIMEAMCSKKSIKESVYISIDPQKLKRAMKSKGYTEDEYLEFIYDVYGLEDGEDFQIGNGGLELGFYKSDSKMQRLKRELGESKLIKEALGANYPIKVEDLIKYGESQANKLKLGMDKWAMKTREEFCRAAHSSLARAWNNPKKEKSENFTGRMINARLSGDLAPWYSNSTKVNQNASREWQAAVLKYLKQKFQVRESKTVHESAEVDTSKWSFSTGKSKPSGRGTWWFKIGDKELSFYGNYSDAKKQAVSYANQRKVSRVILLP